MTESTAPPEVAVNRRTQGVANDPTAPAGAESGTAVIRNSKIPGALTVVPRYAYENSFRYTGWEEVDVDAERDSLFNEARELGVNVSDTAGGREIVEAMVAFRNSNRTVVS